MSLCRAILCCLVIFTIFGIAGYLFALGGTRDNILLNFEPSDPVIFFGKIGLGVAIMCGISMILLPCRDALLIIPRKIKHLSSRSLEPSNANESASSETTPLKAAAANSESYLMNSPHPNITSFIDDDDDFAVGRGRNLSDASASSDELDMQVSIGAYHRCGHLPLCSRRLIRCVWPPLTLASLLCSHLPPPPTSLAPF